MPQAITIRYQMRYTKRKHPVSPHSNGPSIFSVVLCGLFKTCLGCFSSMTACNAKSCSFSSSSTVDTSKCLYKPLRLLVV